MAPTPPVNDFVRSYVWPVCVAVTALSLGGIATASLATWRDIGAIKSIIDQAVRDQAELAQDVKMLKIKVSDLEIRLVRGKL